ncbi:MAG: ATP-binding protein [Roseibium sp.]|uniref:ATP-binding protein n=1 Tax=Roseibium polysiphoniae TaxID=2571221 RepID=UPI003298640A
MKKLTEKQRRHFIRKSSLKYKPSRKMTKAIVGEVVEIKLPENFSLGMNFDNTVAVINQIRTIVLLKNGRVFIDFSDVSHIGISAAIVFVAELHRCKNLKPGRGFLSVNGNYPGDPEVYRVLYNLNFYRLLGVPEIGSPPKLVDGSEIMLMTQSFVQIDPERINTFKEIFTLPFEHLTDIAKRRMQGALIEAMANSFEHAFQDSTTYPRFGRRAWLSGYINHDKREMLMIIFDHGIGIPKSLPPRIIERLRPLLSLAVRPSDSQVIYAATQLGRTSTEQSGRGKGFKTMRKFVDACSDAELRVISDKGRFRYDGNDEFIDEDGVQSVGGTVILLRVRHEESELKAVQ